MSVCIGGTSTSASKSTGSYQSLQQQHSNYQIPASALYDDAEEPKGSMSTSSGRTGIAHISMQWIYLKILFLLITHEKKICSLSSFNNRSCLSTLEMFALGEGQLIGVCRLYEIR